MILDKRLFAAVFLFATNYRLISGMAKKSLVKATEVLSQNTLVQFLPLKLNPKTNKILLNLTVKPGAKSSKLCAVDAEAASIQVRFKLLVLIF